MITSFLVRRVYFPIKLVECSCNICEAIIELKGELDDSPVIAGDINISLLIVDRTTGQKMRKDMEEWRGFYIYKELIYILEIIIVLLKTFINLLLPECHFGFQKSHKFALVLFFEILLAMFSVPYIYSFNHSQQIY